MTQLPRNARDFQYDFCRSKTTLIVSTALNDTHMMQHDLTL